MRPISIGSSDSGARAADQQLAKVLAIGILILFAILALWLLFQVLAPVPIGGM